jgi:hypothetical protein
LLVSVTAEAAAEEPIFVNNFLKSSIIQLLLSVDVLKYKGNKDIKSNFKKVSVI